VIESIGNDDLIKWFGSYIPIEGIERYHHNHDISKPYCIEYDEQGRAHYPDHSRKSYEMYCRIFGHDERAMMIRDDMLFHTAKSDDYEKIWSLPYSDHLYATSWAELFANAELFGGIESDSFKIKKKKLLKALKRRNN
jgi:hypothetical protein